MTQKLLSILLYWFNLVVVSALLRIFHNYYWGNHSTTRYGSGGGSWFVPTKMLKSTSICYSVGVGEDISFDLELIAKTGCLVVAFDPTPRSKKYLAHLNPLPKKFRFEPVGIWTENRKMRFYAPVQDAFVSHSVVNLFKTKKYFTANCVTLNHVKKKLRHKKIDLLKIDVEGAEFTILNSFLQTKERPSVICVEVDQPTRIPKVLAFLEIMRIHGYRVIKQDHWNFTYLYDKNCSF